MCRADLWMTVNLRLELRRDGGDGSQGVRKTATSPGLGMLMDCLRTCTLLVVMADVAAVDILSQCRIYLPISRVTLQGADTGGPWQAQCWCRASAVGPQLSQQLVLGAQHRRQRCQLSTLCQDC